MGCDVVVSAANETLEGGGGVAQAVHAAAGPELLDECCSIVAVPVLVEGGAIPVGDVARCPVGQVRVTKAYNIDNAKWILHTVTPLLDDQTGQPRPDLLAQCYRNCMDALDKLAAESIAFCALGTGFFGFPQVSAAQIAIRTVRDCILSESKSDSSSLKTVIFSTWGPEQNEVYERVLAADLVAGSRGIGS